MKTIAISNWMAYVPFRTSAEALERLAVDLCDGAHDRVDGLDNGRYAAAPMSTYALAEALPRLGDRVGVAWISVVPHGAGSDRIVCRRGIQTAADLHRARIGVTPDGLEPHLFEHIFDVAGLAPKTNYVALKNRDDYFAAFTSGRIDAMMAPQPVRSKLFANVPDIMLFESDADLPRGGLYAPLVYRRSDWTGEELAAVHSAFTHAASELAGLDDEGLRQKHPSSFEGIAHPAAEVRETLRWPSIEESARYLESTGEGSFLEHLRQVVALRARRFSVGRPADSILVRIAS